MKEYKLLGIIYILYSTLKVILGLFVPQTLGFSDSFAYSKLAYAITHYGSYLIFNNIPNSYPPLYPLLLSPAYLFTDIRVALFLSLIITCIISASTIIPIYLLARKFLDKRKSMIIVFLIMLTYPLLLYSNLIMAENLLYPLISWYAYFLYLGLTKNNVSYYFLSGIFLGLSILTKISTIALFGVSLITIIFLILTNTTKFNLKGISLHFLIPLIFLAFYFTINISHGLSLFGNSYEGIVARTANIFIIDRTLAILNWTIIYIGTVAISSGIMPFLYLFSGTKLNRKKILPLLVIAASLIIMFAFEIAIKNSGGTFQTINFFPFLTSVKIVTRYLDPILPIIILAGMVSFFKNKFKKKQLLLGTIFTGLILLVTSQINVFTLFPGNNGSLTSIGMLDLATEFLFFGKLTYDTEFYLLSFLIVMVFLIALPFIFALSKKYALHLMAGFLILNSLFAYGILIYDSHNWYNSDQTKFGLALNDISSKDDTFFFNTDDCVEDALITKESLDELLCRYRFENRRALSWTAFWLNRDIIFDSLDKVDEYDVDYIISVQDLDYELVLEKGIFKAYKNSPPPESENFS